MTLYSSSSIAQTCCVDALLQVPSEKVRASKRAKAGSDKVVKLTAKAQ